MMMIYQTLPNIEEGKRHSVCLKNHTVSWLVVRNEVAWGILLQLKKNNTFYLENTRQQKKQTQVMKMVSVLSNWTAAATKGSCDLTEESAKPPHTFFTLTSGDWGCSRELCWVCSIRRPGIWISFIWAWRYFSLRKPGMWIFFIAAWRYFNIRRPEIWISFTGAWRYFPLRKPGLWIFFIIKGDSGFASITWKSGCVVISSRE